MAEVDAGKLSQDHRIGFECAELTNSPVSASLRDIPFLRMLKMV